MPTAGATSAPWAQPLPCPLSELGAPEARFEFVHFLEGREKEKRAAVADERALAATVTRPKWDIVQP